MTSALRGAGGRPGSLRVSIALLLLLGLASGQNLSLRGEVGLDSGVFVTAAVRREAQTSVPALVRSRLELNAALAGGIEFDSALLPAFGVGPGGDEPLFSLGLQEAVFTLRSSDDDLSAGFQRLPLGQMRLVEPVSLERRLPTSEPGGPLLIRLSHYSGEWRASGALLAVTGDDLLPDGPGGVFSLRRETPAFTVEGHALWTVRPALGVTASGSLDSLVVYGEGWVLADPLDARGGLGVSSYLGEWLLTFEAAWAAPAGELLLQGRPILALNASRAIGFSAGVDTSVAISWPHTPVAPQRLPRIDAALSLRQDMEDASLTVTPALQLSDGMLAGALRIAVRAYF